MEEYEQENQLIFKLQQRKLSRIKVIAEHVVSQISPDWKEEGGEESEILRGHLTSFFKLGYECKLLNDNVLFRVVTEKKLQVHVQSIRNLAYKGSFKIKRPFRCFRCVYFKRSCEFQ